MWLKKLIQIWKIKDLRNSILFVAAMLVVFRLAAHIPIPGIDTQALSDFFASNQLLGIYEHFVRRRMENFQLLPWV
jgi:preprotein translocase subunit SecY